MLKILKWIFATPFILLGVALAIVILGVTVCELNKSYWDRQVKKLCANDKEAGLTVYETRTITKKAYPKMWNDYGNYQLRGREDALNNGSPFYVDWVPDVTIRKSTPWIRRAEGHLVEAETGKILSKFVSYHRVGGDFPTGIAANSSFSCPEMTQNTTMEAALIVTDKK
jgi:hypothetical protein